MIPRFQLDVLFRGSCIMFTAIDDDLFRIERDPVERETNGPKDYDMIRDNRTAFTNGSTYEPATYTTNCCQVLRCLASLPGDLTGAPNIGSLSVSWLKNEREILNMPNRYNITSRVYYNTGQNETRIHSDLRLIPFQQSTDTGIYQCMFFDFDSDGEVLTTTPFRLDSRKSDNFTDYIMTYSSMASLLVQFKKQLGWRQCLQLTLFLCLLKSYLLR